MSISYIHEHPVQLMSVFTLHALRKIFLEMEVFYGCTVRELRKTLCESDAILDWEQLHLLSGGV